MAMTKTPKIRYDMQFKLIVVGDTCVGKSCILLRYVDDMFKLTFISTIGVDCKEKTIEVDGKLIKLQIWDTAGQERFRTISAQYYRGAKGILLVFDITNQKSFDNVTKWLKSIEQHASSDVERLLVGNKCDLQSKRVIPYNKGQQMAEAQNISYMETSAKTNDNIDKAFEMLARQIIAKTGDKMIVNDHRDGPVLNKYQDSQRKHQGRSSTLEKKSRQDSPIVDLKQKENTNKCSC